MDQFKLDLFTDEQKKDLNNLKDLADKKLNSNTPGPFKDNVLNDEDKKDLALLNKNPEVYIDSKIDLYDSEPKPNPNVPFTDPENWNFKAKDYLDAKEKLVTRQKVEKEIDDDNRLTAHTFSTPYLDVPISEAWKVKEMKQGKSPDYRWDFNKKQFIHRKTKKITPTREVLDAYNKTGPIKYTKANLNIKPLESSTGSALTSLIYQNRKDEVENQKKSLELKQRYQKLLNDYENSKPKGGLPSLKDLIEV